MENLVGYLNGEYVPQEELKVSVWDEWLNQGWAVFEMTRSFFGEPFMLREHLDRLYTGLRYCRIPPPMTKESLEAICREVQKRNVMNMEPDDEHRLAITISPGSRKIYRHVGRTQPTVVVADFPLRWTVEGLSEFYEQGVHLQSSHVQQPDPRSLHSNVKHRSRLHFAMAAEKTPWSVLSDRDGKITEGAGFNVVMVKEGALFSNIANDSLMGISLAFVMGIAKNMGLVTVPLKFDVYDILLAEEVFITATPFCMLPVTKFDDFIVGTGKPGPVYQALLAQWSKLVGVDIKEQIKQWDLKD